MQYIVQNTRVANGEYGRHLVKFEGLGSSYHHTKNYAFVQHVPFHLLTALTIMLITEAMTT